MLSRWPVHTSIGIATTFGCLLLACHGSRSPTEAASSGGSDACGPYTAWQTSAYTLPYPQGRAYVVSQGNCSSGSHHGTARHAYDFAMPIGTSVVAARAGSVVFSSDSKPDTADPSTGENLVIILHEDGTRAFYSHLQQHSRRVNTGDRVETGDPLATSGNSGATSGLPHLHFQVTPCPDRDACGTLPVTFRNTIPNPNGLVPGTVYPATAR